MASAYHSSNLAPGRTAALFRERRRRAARAFFPLVHQMLGGELGAAPCEPVAVQQLVDPPGTDGHLGTLLQVGGQARTRPAREDEAQVPGVCFHRAQQKLNVGGTDARRTARARRVGKPLHPHAPPALPTAVHGACSHAQGARDAGSALPLGTPQHDGSSQCHPRVLLLMQCTLKAPALGACQDEALSLRTHIAAPSHPSGQAAMLPP